MGRSSQAAVNQEAQLPAYNFDSIMRPLSSIHEIYWRCCQQAGKDFLLVLLKGDSDGLCIDFGLGGIDRGHGGPSSWQCITWI